MKTKWKCVGTDAISWVLSLILAALLRYDFAARDIQWRLLAIACIAAVLLQFITGMAVNLYQGRYTKGTFEEVNAITRAVVATGVILWVGSLILSLWVPVSSAILLMAMIIALSAILAGRYISRLVIELHLRPGRNSTPVLVVGAGSVGTHLVNWLSNDPESPYRVAGLIDDIPSKRGRRIRRAVVLGDSQDIPAVAEKTGARIVVVALKNPVPAYLRKLQTIAERANLTVKIMPDIDRLLNNRLEPGDLRNLSIEDLLGRTPVDTHVAEIAGYLTGKRVLVTGAGGSIGSQLCEEIKQFAPSELIMLDRDETALQHVQINIDGNGLLSTPDVVLADIRDGETITRIFEQRRPEVVFHAAALKHLPMLEQYPDEAWKTNVLGTLNVLTAARTVGVSTFINISTDKAANPTSVLGHSKRYAERLTAWMGAETEHRYLSVRFGNVIGSRGSMLPTFTRLIEENKPITVTHPDITRFFMTIPEACQLVLQAGGIGSSGEVLILDMGQPVKIMDIAQRMIMMSGKDIEIVITGLRPGEKLHEELTGNGEETVRPFHPKISHTRVQGLGNDYLDKSQWDLALGKEEVAHQTSEAQQ